MGALTLGVACLGSVAAVALLPAGNSAASPSKKKKNRFVRVKKIRPRTGRTFVKLDTSITVRFSRSVDPASVTPANVTIKRLLGDPVLYTAEYSKKGRRLVISPVVPLDPGTDYQVIVRRGVRSTDGRELKSEKRSVFFTDPTVDAFRYLHPEQFEALDSRMIEGRAAHSATLLSDGRVLLAGGSRDYVNVSGSADVFDSGRREFSPVLSTLAVPRAYHVAAPLAGGAVIIGGWSGLDAIAKTELFDITRDVFIDAGDLNEKRDFVAAVALDDGGILVAGGLSYSSTGAAYSKTAEIFAGGAGWRYARGEMTQRRAGHALTLLADGRVLVTGGLPPGSSGGPVAEIFDPNSETFTVTGSPPLVRRQLHTATFLPNSGWVLIADGGVGQIELYDPLSDRFFDAGGASFTRRTRSTASLLDGDRVLLAGGFDTQGNQQLILSGMDLFLPNQNGIGRTVRASVVFPEPRAGHTATNLTGGHVLFTGGFGPVNDSLDTAILYSPVR